MSAYVRHRPRRAASTMNSAPPSSISATVADSASAI